MSELVQLPIIVNGESRYPDGVRKTLRLRYRGDLVVEIPEVTEAEIAEVLENRERLSHLSLPEVSNYLANTGAKWVDPSYKIRKQSLELSC